MAKKIDFSKLSLWYSPLNKLNKVFFLLDLGTGMRNQPLITRRPTKNK